MRAFVRWLTLLSLCSSALGAASLSEAGVGAWIWAEKMSDRQECRFVRRFDIPEGSEVASAILRITADNSYQVFLDGQPIGQGGDWRVLIEYDVTRLLGPGPHVLAVSAVNDFDVAGLLAGLFIVMKDGSRIEIASDESWELAPENVADWRTPDDRKRGAWKKATVVEHYGAEPNPQVYRAPVSLPVEPTLWQKRWFQVTVISLGVAGVVAGAVLSGLLVLKSQAARVVRRERARIAADLHDGLGGGLTHLILLGEAARRDGGAGEGAADRLARLCDQARALSGGMSETIWLINSQRDTVRDLASYLVRHAEAFFRDTSVRCRFEIAEDLPDVPCDLGVRRNLFLAVKEALNNALRHSGAREVELRVESRRGWLRIAIHDDGQGFDSAAVRAGEGLRNLTLRAREAGGRCLIESAPGRGTSIELWAPLASRPRFGARV
jgi:signal transduction histidine kinase